MMQTEPNTIAHLEQTVYLLRERERTLRYLTQSTRCRARPEAELELDKVRAEIAATFGRLRHAHPPS